MENQTCLVEEYIVPQPSKFEMTVKGIEDIKYVDNIKEATNGAYLLNGLSENMIDVFKPNQEEIFYSAGKKKYHLSLKEKKRFGRVPPTTIVRAKYFNGDITTDWKRSSKIEFDRHAFWE
ncbi:unnamed protein product [Brassica rapa]|uniref:Uncharacterized protein n=1 Tax=Brassica campestris TaxID=3711 RepID=A0A3P6DBV6_BRACM|nr:unnamed protein product [Brassica rapa]VDD16679.1 unnamed protein product [Brassica rapa]